MNAAMQPAAVAAPGVAVGGGAEGSMAGQEQLLAEIFELDLDQLAPMQSNSDETQHPKERAVAAEPGSFERDFWEQVTSFEQELAQNGKSASSERLHAAIAMAATSMSLEHMEPAPFQKLDGSNQLASQRDTLTRRAEQAVAVAQGLKGSALRAATQRRG